MNKQVPFGKSKQMIIDENLYLRIARLWNNMLYTPGQIAKLVKMSRYEVVCIIRHIYRNDIA